MQSRLGELQHGIRLLECTQVGLDPYTRCPVPRCCVSRCISTVLLFPSLPQVKHNRRSEGLPEGFFVDVPLADLGHPSHAETSLSAVVGGGPYVVIAGSMT